MSGKRSSRLSDQERLEQAVNYSAIQDGRIRRLADALGKITEGAGAYSRDPFTHCTNAVEAMTATAREALARLREDVANGV